MFDNDGKVLVLQHGLEFLSLLKTEDCEIVRIRLFQRTIVLLMHITQVN